MINASVPVMESRDLNPGQMEMSPDPGLQMDDITLYNAKLI
jgi:hypothetical protein